MSTFTNDLQYLLQRDGKAKVLNTVRFYLSDNLAGEYIEITPGILTNFASIPKVIQFLFPHDHQDYKMAAAFHDALVNEFGQQIFIMKDGKVVRKPSWQESAMWFREMMFVRQRTRRGKLDYWKRSLALVMDVITRWIFWLAVSIHGLI